MPELQRTTNAHRPGRTMASVALALLIGIVLQFAAVAKVATGVRHLEQLNASNLAVSQGLPAKVTAENYEWLIRPGAMPGSPFERGVLLDIAVGTAEFGVVLFVLAFCRTRIVWVLVPVMFAMFFGYALEKTLAGKPCGCFGALWEPPKGFSIVMDAVFVVAGLGLARWHGLKSKTMVALVVITLGAGIGGYLYSRAGTPAKPIAPTSASAPSNGQTASNPAPTGTVAAPVIQKDDRPPGERLLASDMLADLRGLTEDDPAWYVFIWDPTCPTCDAMLPIIQFQARQFEEEGNPVLQVRDIQKKDIETQAGIEEWQWSTSPAVLIIRGGRIIAEYGGEGAPFPGDVSDRLFENKPIDDLQAKP